MPNVKEIITAGAKFEQYVFSQKICHMNQPALTQAVSNAEHRPIGGGYGFGGDNSAPIEAASLALWGCRNAKRNPRKK